MESKRQLAAIMFTDIVGYTALMGADEEEGMRLLRRNRAGKSTEALRWLEKGYVMHDVITPYAFVFEEFASLRTDPRFAEIAEKIKLPL